MGINNYSVFNGTIVCNNGALGAINTGVVINGRLLTTTGALTTTAVTALMPPGCSSGAPSISTEPGNQTACEGSTVSLVVTAHGTGGNISGTHSAILTFNPVQVSNAGSNYNVIVTGTLNPKDTSVNVSLTVNTSPNITTQPANRTACVGSSVSFSVVAAGAGVSYRWKKGNVNLTNGGNISGATSATLTISPMGISDTASNYRVVVIGTCSPNDTSNKVFLKACITGIGSLDTENENAFNVFPNPFHTSLEITMNDAANIENAELHIFNILGAEVAQAILSKQVTSLQTSNLPSGIYSYKVLSNNKIIQTGRLISQQ